ncbi:unnamed protein product [Blepharisma stoltei]|uniref:t-SNARE coiled-coil homology domain-containing protein n=1 Tax=Blepharisma stoltei TaxID=1481888 RepID=A0AAU9IH73_9CILI|nr:unnamed protein product [Blepharisma stoltei]
MDKRRDRRIEDHVEDENNKKIKVLHSQVSEIKAAANNIYQETKDSNSFLDVFNGQMEKGKAGVRNVFDRFEGVLADRNNRLSIYIAGFLTILFLIVWKYAMYSGGESS